MTSQRFKPLSADEMSAEQMASSVIYNDTAYDVIDGFIGEPLPP